MYKKFIGNSKIDEQRCCVAEQVADVKRTSYQADTLKQLMGDGDKGDERHGEVSGCLASFPDGIHQENIGCAIQAVGQAEPYEIGNLPMLDTLPQHVKRT